MLNKIRLKIARWLIGDNAVVCNVTINGPSAVIETKAQLMIFGSTVYGRYYKHGEDYVDTGTAVSVELT